ncbi:MAG: hypothetical protein LQ338_002812 [Usnochroma carphineum]|nr:MAG: hypothetical protein LQ338_002812 [Usnochroma carphineum]
MLCPWNQHTCTTPSASPISLTFDFGIELARSSILPAFKTARDNLQLWIRQGHGDRPLRRAADDLVIGYGGGQTYMHVRAFQKPGRSARREAFTYKQILVAVDLLEYCGPARGSRDEMWAYVFEDIGEEKKQIGYIWFQFYRYVTVAEGGNVTVS